MSAAETNAANIRVLPKPSVHELDETAPARGEVTAEAPAHQEAPRVAPQRHAAPGPAPKGKGGGRGRVVISVIALAAVLGAGWYGYNYFTVGRFMVSTDDAYIGGDITTISAKISDYVEKVDVVANQHVKAGDALIELDAGDYLIARDQAQAQVDTQNLTLKRIDAQIVGGDASVVEAEAQKTADVASQHNAVLSQQRAQSLTASAVSTQATLDTANATLEQANANVAAADAAIAAAKANVAVFKGQRAEAAGTLKSDQLALDKANRDLSFTVLRAPFDGVVGNLSVQKGDFVSAGVNLAAVVPTGQLYIDANFKETQLAQLVPGEKVLIHLDAEDGIAIEGTIQSLSPASGSVFSLLPTENATGNFTKVVQRVPVRIALPQDALDSGKLRAGLSVLVEADTRTIPKR
ncbi:MAG: HlyD family secretion protein [Devosia sp.]|nr:HlyD family secretion protein [Devosia sp.]